MSLVDFLFSKTAFSDADRKQKGGTAETGRRGNVAMLNVAEPNGVLKPSDALFCKTNVTEARRAKAWLDDRIMKGAEGVFTEEVVLTPVRAELLLGLNVDNRNLRERAVETYRTDIVNGDWSLNGETIKVSRDGYLNDGQHRCHAVIAAGRNIRTLITFGLDRESRMTVDQGAVRTAGNYLSMAGHKDSNNIAAVASLIWQYENDGNLVTGNRTHPTKAQVNQTAANHPKIHDSILAIPTGGTKVASKSVLAFCHYLMARRAGTHAATSFILNLCLGGVEGRTNPINRVRDRLLADGKKMRAPEKVELIFRGWNASRNGSRLDRSAPILGTIPTLER